MDPEDTQVHHKAPSTLVFEQEIRRALIPKDAMDERNVILEIRAGTGGDALLA